MNYAGSRNPLDREWDRTQREALNNRRLGLVITAAPADTETLDTNQLLRDAMELCRRLNIEAVKVRVGKITYYAHKDHVVRKIRSNSYDVLKEPFNVR